MSKTEKRLLTLFKIGIAAAIVLTAAYTYEGGTISSDINNIQKLMEAGLSGHQETEVETEYEGGVV